MDEKDKERDAKRKVATLFAAFFAVADEKAMQGFRDILDGKGDEFQESIDGKCPECGKELTLDGTTKYCEQGCF